MPQGLAETSAVKSNTGLTTKIENLQLKIYFRDKTIPEIETSNHQENDLKHLLMIKSQSLTQAEEKSIVFNEVNKVLKKIKSWFLR